MKTLILGAALLPVLAGACSSPPERHSAPDESPFGYFQECGDVWGKLVVDWSEGPAKGSTSIAELRSRTLGNDSTSIGRAFASAWSVNAGANSSTGRRYAFLDSLEDVPTGCLSIEWMAVALAGRDKSLWPLNVSFPEIPNKVVSSDESGTIDWIDALIEYDPAVVPE